MEGIKPQKKVTTLQSFMYVKAIAESKPPLVVPKNKVAINFYLRFFYVI